MKLTLLPCCWTTLWLTAALSGCLADKTDHPPELTSTGTDNPVLCDRLNDAQHPPVVNATGSFVVDGRQAGCMAEGQKCVLVWASDQCDAELAVAECSGNAWKLTCSALPASDADDQLDSASSEPGDSGADGANDGD